MPSDINIDDLKAGQERWEARFKQFFPPSDDLVTTVLRGHLLIEEILEELIRNYAFRKQEVQRAKLTFYQKAVIAKAFVMDPLPPEVWDSILALNSLRNGFAHSLEPERIKEKIEAFTSYRKAEMDAKIPIGSRDVDQVSASISFLIGQLSLLDYITKFMEGSKKYG